MISQWEVFERLRQVISISDEDAPALLPFCKAAALSVERRLKYKRDSGNQLIIMLCAMTALHRFLLSRSATDQEFTSFRAGDVTVKKGYKETLQAASDLEAAAFKEAAHLLKDDAFLFGRI
ncbi:MAG: hypothetical protein GX264_04790 [Clostridiales bacterium]|jgi:hypothetical protein|nr:hypothetical protein [Clostridiales bacterium]